MELEGVPILRSLPFITNFAIKKSEHPLAGRTPKARIPEELCTMTIRHLRAMSGQDPWLRGPSQIVTIADLSIRQSGCLATLQDSLSSCRHFIPVHLPDLPARDSKDCSRDSSASASLSADQSIEPTQYRNPHSSPAPAA